MTSFPSSRQQAATELLARRRARTELLAFTAYTNPSYEAAAHHELIAAALERVMRGEVTRLIICMPPRHGKSELASRRFPSYYMGRHPDRQIIAASYNSDLANDFGREVRNIVNGQEFGTLFSVRLAEDSKAANRWHTDAGGMYVAAGVGTAITGRGANILLIDDPFKDRASADSELQQQRVWDWYTSTAYTRLMPDGAVVLINTRWHENDLTGRLLAAQETGGDKWEVLSLPAINTSGVALWPAWYPLERLEQIRGVLPSRDWSSLFQQDPSPDTGTFFQKDWFKRYRPGSQPKHLHKYMTSDHAPAGTDKSDYDCVRVWGVDSLGDLYMLDGFRTQETMDKMADKIVGEKKEKKLGLIQRHKPFCWFPEDDNNWKSAGGFIRRMMREQGVHCRIEPISPHGSDKPTKAQAFQAMASMGRVWIPEGPEGDDVIVQYTKFPTGKHDDEVDAASVIGRALADAHPAILPIEKQKKVRDIWAIDQDDEDGNWRTQ